MRSENDIETVTQVRRNRWAVYQIAENSDIPQPPSHHQDVWVLWRLNSHFHHSVSGHRGSALPSTETQLTNALTKGRFIHQTSLLSYQRNPFFKDHPPWHKALKHCPSLSNSLLKSRTSSNCAILDGLSIKTTKWEPLFAGPRFTFAQKFSGENSTTKKSIFGL